LRQRTSPSSPARTLPAVVLRGFSMVVLRVLDQLWLRTDVQTFLQMMLQGRLRMQAEIGRILRVKGGGHMVAEERASSGSAGRGDEPATVISVTCLSDGRAHSVPDTELCHAAAQGGTYRAVCGHIVTAASMVEPDGKPCRQCSDARESRAPAGPRRLGLRILGS
jgi:hypothetical protein